MNSVAVSVIVVFIVFGFTRCSGVHVRALQPVIFLSPWQGLSADVGVNVSAFQLVVLGALLGNYIRRSSRLFRSGFLLLPGSFYVFLVYVIVNSLAQLPFLPDVTLSIGEARNPTTRAVLQIVVFLLSLAPVLLAATAVRQANDLFRLGRTYLISCLILAGIGWVQVIWWRVTGRDPLPIGFLQSVLTGSDSILRTGLYGTDVGEFIRMCSFGGEPKGLGQALVVALLLIQTGVLAQLGVKPARRISITLILAISAVATLSTSALALWTIGSLVVALQAISSRNSRETKNTPLIFPLALGILAAALVGYVSISGPGSVVPGGASVSDILIERTLGRSLIEDFDQAVLGFLAQAPLYGILGVGLGNVHLYADEFLDPLTAAFAHGMAFVAKSGYLRLISEAGIIGLALFCVSVISIIRRLGVAAKRVQNPREKVLLHSLTCLAGVLFFFFLGRTYVAPQFYLVLGVCSSRVVARASQGVATWAKLGSSKAACVGQKSNLKEREVEFSELDSRDGHIHRECRNNKRDLSRPKRPLRI
ncbi:hypothetical protein [Methylotetracoccus oryzae]|uniref:hypothetical protein n=1 Tax=Methylotetracoccus oryzae TaxID=1919059 RepID=UPI0011189979|nr:hypothetical protein [Methylotetracoccus oryzae]